ncbi:MAG: HPr family phosphocarrier protein [Eubacteriales bacterium]|nr:HPr family phosphocarrier protein [Eubacteriales bacterium]
MISENIHFNSTKVLDPKFVANCVQVSCDFKSTILIKTLDKTVNLKSIMGMMSFDFENIKDFLLEVNGEDEKEAIKVIKAIFI